MTVYSGVLRRGFPLFCVHGAQQTTSRQVKIRFRTGMLGDILENNIFPGDQIVKILH
jgi:hypothetical protein